MRSPATDLHTVVAGVVCALVGFTSSFAVVLAGLQAVGAAPQQAVSGLMAVTLTMGLGTLVFSWRTRTPITMAWSTPGAALLAGTAAPHGGFPTAVGAFIVTGVLLALAGLVRPFGRLVQRIPTSLASAMLAGVLLTLCIAPFTALAKTPGAIAPVLLVWLVVLRLAPTWAVPAALVAALGVMAARGSLTKVAEMPLLPTPGLVVPGFDGAAVVAIALPLFLVTMTSQNIPGVAVMKGLGYTVAWTPALAYTGGASVVNAFLGGSCINLAAISAALAAGPDAGPDPTRRWRAGVSAGATYLLLVPLSALVVGVANAAATALGDAEHRLPAALTMVVAASGFTALGIGAAFWALLAGLVMYALQRG
ncbi:benzoate/H(+) symporter BenE family transporter [Mariniluteicoccus endophyticus]